MTNVMFLDDICYVTKNRKFSLLIEAFSGKEA